MSISVTWVSKAAGDLANISLHIKGFSDGAVARKVVRALMTEALKLGNERHHRLGEELDGFDGPPPREVRKWVCLDGQYELHYEVLPAHAEKPNSIALIRAWDTRQER